MRRVFFAGVVLLIVAAVVGTELCTPLLAEGREAQASLGSVRALHLVRVPVIVRAGMLPLAVPYCGVDEAGNRMLCSLAATLEVKSTRGWSSAETPKGAGLLGGMPLERASTNIIPAESSAFFVFEFAPNLFVIKPHQELRILVSAWVDESAVRVNGPRIELPTAAFRIP